MICPYCEGQGCEECDRTGRRYRVALDAGDGITLSATGSGEGPSPETADALKEIARLAVKHMEPAPEGNRQER